jgi:hypothetical protein
MTHKEIDLVSISYSRLPNTCAGSTRSARIPFADRSSLRTPLAAFQAPPFATFTLFNHSGRNSKENFSSRAVKISLCKSSLILC